NGRAALRPVARRSRRHRGQGLGRGRPRQVHRKAAEPGRQSGAVVVEGADRAAAGRARRQEYAAGCLMNEAAPVTLTAAAPSVPESTPRRPPVIDITSLSLTFITNDGPVEALSGINLQVQRGEFISLIGPS